MSCKGAPSAYESKESPRIFSTGRTKCLSRGSIRQADGSQQAGSSVRSEAKNSFCLLRLSSDENKAQGKRPKDEKDTAVERVSDIEKWFKTRTEAVMNMDLDSMKPEVEVEVAVDRYLADELSHTFLAKVPDPLSIDIELSDKKLSLPYDPILHDLQNEKLLESCEKDEFMLSEFQLDHLEPLTLSPGDMMVAGEILPSTGSHPPLTDITHENAKVISQIHQPILDQASHCPHQPDHISQPESTPLANVHLVKDKSTIRLNNIATLSQDHGDIYTRVSTSGDIKIPQVAHVDPHLDTALLQCIEPKVKGKSRACEMQEFTATEKRMAKRAGKRNGRRQDIMAVVAISTDKISNMTQIVINTGTEEQIYRGKTSELLQATGNFPQLPKIESSPSRNSRIDSTVNNVQSSHHETIISNALEELGITDDNLQPISITEHGKVWHCPRKDCSRQFSRLYALKGHLLAHYGVRPFKCDFDGCAWAFYSEFKLKRHKETHLKRKDYICNMEGCERRFTTVYNLWSHEKLHSRPNRIVCQVPECQEKFQTKRALELHMKSHDQSHAPYVCTHEGCDKRYYSSNALTSHQRCHSYKEIDVKCSWPGCGKVFDKPCRLKAHVRSHTGCKPYLCTFQGCQWAFSSSSKLKRHQKKHTNERKFICDVASCRKAFMRSEHLKEHRLTHEEGRYFQCYTCDARFSAKSSLYVHVKKHQTNPHESSNSFKLIDIKEEARCSRMSSVKRINGNTSDLLSEPHDSGTTGTQEKDQSKLTYCCPIESCSKSYGTKTSLRAHIQKIHDSVTDGSADAVAAASVDVPSTTDFIFYASTAIDSRTNGQEQTGQMIMVTPCDAVIFSESSEAEYCQSQPEQQLEEQPEVQPEPESTSESPPTASFSSQSAKLQQTLSDSKDQGSARTGLTCTDVWKLKTNSGSVIESVVGEVTDAELIGTADFGGLLLADELPSAYYQDEVVGTEYQVLLLDSGSSESTMNLRTLE